jgi:hypothetical protein
MRNQNCLRSTLVVLLAMFFIVIFMLSLCRRADGQTKFPYRNSLYVVLRPTDLGLGVRYEREFGLLGMYTTFSKGNYYFDAEHVLYIKDHYVSTLGLIVCLPKEVDAYVRMIGGIAYHQYGRSNCDVLMINQKIFDPWSFELGIIFKFNHISISCRTDILKWEGNVDVGFNF